MTISSDDATIASPSRLALTACLLIINLALAAALIALVVVAPLLDAESQQFHGWSKVLALFARDSTVRQTAIASAIALIVTAVVFFRPPKISLPPSPIDQI